MELALVLFCISLLFLCADDVSGIRISEEKCAGYRKAQRRVPLILDETAPDAAPKEFPFMATIVNATGFFHNGVLISENFVLSIAQASFLYYDKAHVFLGDLERKTSDDDARPRTYSVIQTFQHPEFNYDDRHANIKLFKLDRIVQFDEYIRPACLATTITTTNSQESFLQLGWGITNIMNNNKLHKVKVHYSLDETCQQIYRSKDLSQYIKDISTGTIFCAGSNKGDRIVCGGFPGSALIRAEREASDEIIGLASYGFDCTDGNPDVYIRVSAYIDWIESKVWSSENEKAFGWKHILIVLAGVLVVLGLLGALTIYFKICASNNGHQNPTVVQINMGQN